MSTGTNSSIAPPFHAPTSGASSLAALAPRPSAAGRRALLVAFSAFGIFLASAVFYGLCLFPGLGGEINAGDSIKFHILGHTPIMVHGPGYPHVLMLGAIVRALDLPFEPWWTLTFTLSALPAAVANAVAFLIVHRLTRSLLLAAAGALLLGSATLMSVLATEAEVYALNIAFLLTTLYLLILFTQTKRIGYFVAAAAVYAFSFGDHLMMIMALPLFLVLTALNWRLVLRPAPVALILLFVLLGASQYLYLAYVAHDPATSYSEYMPLPPSARELVEYILGTYFGGYHGSGLGSTRTALELGKTIWSAHPWISAPLVALGVVLFFAGWRSRDAAWRGIAVVLGAALCFLPFMLWYGPGDIRAFHLPVLVPLLVAAVASLGWALRRRPVLLQAAASLLLLLGAVRVIEAAGALTDRDNRYAGVESAVRQMVAQAPSERPLIAMGYAVRMATLYHELRGEMPPAVYRLIWRAPEMIGEDRTQVAGVVVPADNYRFVRRIEQQHPGMTCITRDLDLDVEESDWWTAYAYDCWVESSPNMRAQVGESTAAPADGRVRPAPRWSASAAAP